jgi:hypothetical protein
MRYQVVCDADHSLPSPSALRSPGERDGAMGWPEILLAVALLIIALGLVL